MTIRKGLRDLDNWDDNIDTASQFYKTAEKSLAQVSSELYNRANTLMIQGSTTTVGSAGMAAVGVSLRQTAEEMVDTLNADYNGRQMFGGSSQDKTPFEIKKVNAAWEYNGVNYTDADGVTEKVTYLDIDMTTIKKGDPTVQVTDSKGNPVTDAGGNPVMQDANLFYGTQINDDGSIYENVLVPGQGSVLIDIGLGASFAEAGAGNYELDPNTAFDTALHGFEILGLGVDSDGFPSNILQLTLDASKVAEQGDIEQVGKLNNFIDKTETARTNIQDEITAIGVGYSSLDYYKSKNDSSRDALFERQNTVEGTDILKDITEYYAIEAAYNASLQMGANILPKSIWDFI
jgi:flagellin-like hook-associated protein FlgL